MGRRVVVEGRDEQGGRGSRRAERASTTGGARVGGSLVLTNHAPSGSILLIVLLVVAMLTLGTATYLELMQTEHRAVRRHGTTAQAHRLAESGVEYLKLMLSQPTTEAQRLGGWSDNPAALRAALVDDRSDDATRGRFTVLAPQQMNGLDAGLRSGLEDESAKLNLNVLLAPAAEAQAAQRLSAIPGMTPELADAILDWLDADDLPRPLGAESEYYGALAGPYPPRNGPLPDLDDLLCVRGVTPELLYGLDQNRNLSVDPDETPRGVLLDLDLSDGSMNRGWSAYLTVHSVEGFLGPARTPKLDLNGNNLQGLYDQLVKLTSVGEAKFIIALRQNGGGQQPGGQPAGQPNGQLGGGQGGPAGAAVAPGGANYAVGAAGAVGGGGANPSSPAGGGPAVSPESLQLDFSRPGGNRINSLLDLVNATVQVPQPGARSGGNSNGGGAPRRQPGENNGGENASPNNGSGDNGNNANPGGQGATGGQGNSPPPQTVQSPWKDDPVSYRKLLVLGDSAAATATRIAGRININAASRPVLLSISTLPPGVADQIIARRQPVVDDLQSDQRRSLWLLIERIVTLDQMRQIEPLITTGGDAYSGQVVGFFDAGPAVARAQFILDRSAKTPRLRAWTDFTGLGAGFSREILGAAATSPPTP